MVVSITKLMWQSDLMATRFTLAIAAGITGIGLVIRQLTAGRAEVAQVEAKTTKFLYLI